MARPEDTVPGAFPEGGLRLVSGGQSGVDRAALDAALAHDIPCSGWCPAGRWAEDGPIPDRYPLRETCSPDPAMRTRLNVRCSDGTLIVTTGPRGTGAWDPGTELTLQTAERAGRPVFIAELTPEDGTDHMVHARRARAWIAKEGIRTLKVAGPRESMAPGIGSRARTFLDVLLGGGFNAPA